MMNRKFIEDVACQLFGFKAAVLKCAHRHLKIEQVQPSPVGRTRGHGETAPPSMHVRFAAKQTSTKTHVRAQERAHAPCIPLSLHARARARAHTHTRHSIDLWHDTAAKQRYNAQYYQYDAASEGGSSASKKLQLLRSHWDDLNA
jgi:hypothetical protein